MARKKRRGGGRAGPPLQGGEQEPLVSGDAPAVEGAPAAAPPDAPEATDPWNGWPDNVGAAPSTIDAAVPLDDDVPFAYNAPPRWPTVVLGILLGMVITLGGLYPLAQFAPDKTLALLGLEQELTAQMVAVAPVALEPSPAPPPKAPPAAPNRAKAEAPQAASEPEVPEPTARITPDAPPPPPIPEPCVREGQAFSWLRYDQLYGSGGVTNRYYITCLDGRVMMCGPKTRLTDRQPDGSWGINLVGCDTLAREAPEVAGP